MALKDVGGKSLIEQSVLISKVYFISHEVPDSTDKTKAFTENKSLLSHFNQIIQLLGIFLACLKSWVQLIFTCTCDVKCGIVMIK